MAATINTTDYAKAHGSDPSGAGNWTVIDSDGAYLPAIRDIDWADVAALLDNDTYTLCPSSYSYN